MIWNQQCILHHHSEYPLYYEHVQKEGKCCFRFSSSVNILCDPLLNGLGSSDESNVRSLL